MAKQLYPITMRPGIKRDGTPFQSEYCTDGDWMRWQKGLPRSMGGMIAPIGSAEEDNRGRNTSDIMVITKSGNPLIFIGHTENIVAYYVTDRYFRNIYPGGINIASIPQNNEILWQSIIVQRGAIVSEGGVAEDIPVQSYLVYYGCPNANNIANLNGQSINRCVQMSQILNQNPIPANIMSAQFIFDEGNAPTDIDGGICYAAPYLFLYGSGGTVRVSKAQDCFDFRILTVAQRAAREAAIAALPAGARRNNIGEETSQKYILPTGDKVIAGAQIRGGNTNSPTLLFWTLSSVTRLTFQASDSEFKADVISTDSTILSNKSIVEYKGMFFWVGTDGFYNYNGVVNPVPNTISMDYFFDNLNQTYSAKVFGVRFKRYNEIWWFYPSGNSTICNRAIIYNVAENSWYDVALTRSAGTYVPSLYSIVTYGYTKAFGDEDVQTYPFLHEAMRPWEQVEDARHNITRYFVTPYFSFAAFNPLKQQVGTDNLTVFNRLEPDFIGNKNNVNNSAVIDVELLTQDYALSVPISNLLGSIILGDGFGGRANDTKRIDAAIQGGHMQLKFSSIMNFEMGHNMIQISVGDGQR